jgi:hypothetical protein
MMAAIRTARDGFGCCKSFGATVALGPLNLEIAEGEVLGYLGPDGAGKSTTIRCLPECPGRACGRRHGEANDGFDGRGGSAQLPATSRSPSPPTPCAPSWKAGRPSPGHGGPSLGPPAS